MSYNWAQFVKLSRTGRFSPFYMTALFVGIAVSCSVASTGRAAEESSVRRVAITFDDLPGAALTQDQRCDATKLLSVSTRILAPFLNNGWPTTAFVTEGRLCDELDDAALDAVLEKWIDAGAELGNHTYSHRDLNNQSVQEYTDDIIRGETALRRVLGARGKTLRYFRYPLLHAGDEPEKKRSVASFLKERGYSNGLVTMDNQEFVYAEVYARALGRGDEAMMSRVVDGYLLYLEESVAYYENLSMERFGRDIPHVLLLHVTALNADHIDKVLSLLQDRGYAFESLESVLGDEVYEQDDVYVGPVGLSWIHRWFEDGVIESKNEPRESDEIRELFRTYPAKK